MAEGRTEGFTALRLDRRGRLVGATVVGPRAGESLAELSLAVTHGLRARAVAATTHAYPTYSDAVWSAAVADVRASLSRGAPRAVTSGLVGLRRRWLDVR